MVANHNALHQSPASAKWSHVGCVLSHTFAMYARPLMIVVHNASVTGADSSCLKWSLLVMLNAYL